MKIEMVAAGAALLVSIVGGTVAIENRYTLHSEFKEEVASNQRYHLERELRMAQDRLNELLNTEPKRDWMTREIQRLRDLIRRLERQLAQTRG